MKSIHQVIVLTCLLQLSSTQILNQGSCNRSIPTVKNFDANRYLGRWYEQQKYPFVFELGGKCIYAEYGLQKNGDVRVYNYNINELTNQPTDILGSAKIEGSGKLKVRFNNMPSFIGSADYWVLDTDYENYSVVYSCTDILGFVNGQVIWILTRERNPNPQYIELARSLSSTQILNQGSCNRSIPTVKNFDANRYLGRWYEQQKYPFVFELGGKCIYAEYGLQKNGDVRVYNYNINELTNQPTDILGSAKIEGSGKLKVRFNNMPSFIGSADYWVLDTDYENYSVVYSCTDILGFVNGQVIWILTRERNPNPQYIELARSVIKQNGLSLKPLQRTNQNGC